MPTKLPLSARRWSPMACFPIRSPTPPRARTLPHPRCVAGLVGGQNAGGDDRWPFILQNPADRFEHRRHGSRQPLDCRAGRTAAPAPVAPLASLGSSAAGPTRKAVSAAPGRPFWRNAKFFCAQVARASAASGGGPEGQLGRSPSSARPTLAAAHSEVEQGWQSISFVRPLARPQIVRLAGRVAELESSVSLSYLCHC